MSGRHRRTGTTTARRALVASVPALGVIGAVTAATGADPAASPDSVATASTGPSTPTVMPLAPATAAGPAVTEVASDAARAAGRAGEQQRAAEKREIQAVVNDVRTDARDRDAVVAAQGRDRLDAFENERERQQQPAEATAPEPESTDRCDTSGMPAFGDRADPDEIVDRDCGMTDLFGRQRSSDGWIDGQLLSATGD